MTFRVDLLTNILVTGGAGFIGHHLVRRLSKDNDCKITIIDNLSNSNKNFGTQLPNRNIIFYKEDIRNRETISDILKRERIETCIHLAAKISVFESIVKPYDTVDVNVNGTLSILDACADNDVKNFVFASSAAVYGAPKVLPVLEDHPLEPLSPYGASKVACEALATSYRNSGKIPNTTSLRFFNVYGEGQTLEYAGVITKFLERLSKGLPPIIFGDGKQTRDFISVEDVVTAILLAVESKVPGVFNIGTGKPISISELATKLINAFDLEIKPIYEKAKQGDIVHSYANTLKSADVLNFTAIHTLESSMRNQK
jgi:UDP-glucose 4-epimerase